MRAEQEERDRLRAEHEEHSQNGSEDQQTNLGKGKRFIALTKDRFLKLFIALSAVGFIIPITYYYSKIYSSSGLSNFSGKVNRSNLVCELQPLLSKISGLRVLTDEDEIYQRNLLRKIRRKISFVNPDTGQKPYLEDELCRFGYQLYDEQPAQSWRLFVAVSKECKAPRIRYSIYSYIQNKSSILRETKELRLDTGYLGDVYINRAKLHHDIKVIGIKCM